MLSRMKLYNDFTMDARGLLRSPMPLPQRVALACSDRTGGPQGGYSSGAYQSLNLGLHVGDDATCVERNRAAFQAALGVRAVYLEQVHGVAAIELTQSTPHGVVADVAWTTQPGLACTVMVADCLPVLLWNQDGSCVAAAHAGWRGLLGSNGVGVLEQALACMGGPATAVSAWLGPCIGPAAFEVGDELRDAFMHAASPGPSAVADAFTPLTVGGSRVPGKWLADLPGLARRRLAALGVQGVHGNDGSLPWCTVSQPSRFFSHRRDRVSGRQAAAIWLSAGG